jgi:hypothetical protein
MSTSVTESKSLTPSDNPGETPKDAIGEFHISKPMLVITEQDLSNEARGTLAAIKRKDRVLGGERPTEVQTLLDAIPGAIARRLQRITPENFTLAEITIELALDVTIPGFEMGGTVTVTLQPKG